MVRLRIRGNGITPEMTRRQLGCQVKSHRKHGYLVEKDMDYVCIIQAPRYQRHSQKPLQSFSTARQSGSAQCFGPIGLVAVPAVNPHPPAQIE